MNRKQIHVSLLLSHVPKCGSSRWGCSWYPFIIAEGGNGQCYEAETAYPVITNTLIGGLRMTVLPKNLSTQRSLVNASLWTSGRLEMSALVSSVSLKPPNRDSFPVIPGSPCSPFSASGRAILLDFGESQRLMSVFLDTSTGLVSLLLALRVSQRNSCGRKVAWKTTIFWGYTYNTDCVSRVVRDYSIPENKDSKQNRHYFSCHDVTLPY